MSTSLSSTYRKHEAEKKCMYGQRVRDVENASFTPLVFSTTGGMSKETTGVPETPSIPYLKQ